MQHWRVIPDCDDPKKGWLEGPLLRLRCALGKGGLLPAQDKREGDKASPVGKYAVRRVFYRPDKVAKPITALPIFENAPNLGWCDAPDHKAYNKLVSLPFSASHEKLWREDDLYDLVLVIGHNDAPVVAGHGSAIFLHIMRNNYSPTDGCVSFKREDLVKFLRLLQPDDKIEICWPNTAQKPVL